MRKSVREKSNHEYSLSISIQTTINHISICFLPQYQRKRKYFFRARAEKGIARHIDASSVVWTLIDNDKLAKQIARLAAIVVKRLLTRLPLSTGNFHDAVKDAKRARAYHYCYRGVKAFQKFPIQAIVTGK